MTYLNVGGHLSLHGKPLDTVQWAAENGFGCMQIFASSPGAWKPPVLDRPYADAFIRKRAECGVDPLFIHAIYLINLASADPGMLQRSVCSLIVTMEAGARLGAAGVVTHLGSHAGRGFHTVADQIAQAISEVVNSTPESIHLLLENSAGSGASVGAQLEELGKLISRAGSPQRLGVALDTAHLCGAGWDLREGGTASRLVHEVDREIGLSRLRLIHANDSAQPCGSKKDRHANIGQGHIGLLGFEQLVAQPALRQVPWILETPNLEQRVEDLTLLQGMAEGACERESVHGA